MKGFQLQEYETIGGVIRTGTHPRVYKSRWRAWVSLFFSGEFMFADFRVVPAQGEDSNVG